MPRGSRNMPGVRNPPRRPKVMAEVAEEADNTSCGKLGRCGRHGRRGRRDRFNRFGSHGRSGKQSLRRNKEAVWLHPNAPMQKQVVCPNNFACEQMLVTPTNKHLP